MNKISSFFHPTAFTYFYLVCATLESTADGGAVNNHFNPKWDYNTLKNEDAVDDCIFDIEKT